MLRLIILFSFLSGTVYAQSLPVYFNPSKGITPRESPGQISFGMSPKAVKAILKKATTSTHEGRMALLYVFHCMASDCTLEDASSVIFTFSKNKLNGIMISGLDFNEFAKTAETIYEASPDKTCVLTKKSPQDKAVIKVSGWSGKQFNTVITKITTSGRLSMTLVFMEFSTDGLRFDFDQPDCQ